MSIHQVFVKNALQGNKESWPSGGRLGRGGFCGEALGGGSRGWERKPGLNSHPVCRTMRWGFEFSRDKSAHGSDSRMKGRLMGKQERNKTAEGSGRARCISIQQLPGLAEFRVCLCSREEGDKQEEMALLAVALRSVPVTSLPIGSHRGFMLRIPVSCPKITLTSSYLSCTLHQYLCIYYL